MSRAIEFIKECGIFFVLTINNDAPAGRPFGAIMEINDDLYISTTDMKKVYAQLKACPKMQILALKNGTRSWVRIDGEAKECFELSIKQKMLEECPILTKHFPTVDTPHYSVFKIKVAQVEFNE